MRSSDAFTPPAASARRSAAAVQWLPWTPDAFERAARERKPVLLSITTSWCHGCAVMDRTCYAEPGIAGTINHRFVPVRVDADRRPDVHDRYNLEGLPTTAFLTPSGEILTGSTYLPPERLASLLVEVADAYEARGSELDDRAASAAASRREGAGALPVAVDPDLAAPAWIAQQIVEGCDPEFGGFGTDGKFLNIPAVRVAVAEYASTRDPALARVVTLTLDGMAQGAVRDSVEGGFFRYASRDWTKPHTEKLLEDQAGIVRLYLEAAEVFDRPGWRDVARETIAYVGRTLADPGGAGFYASVSGDEPYYQLASAELRRAQGPPPVDRTRFADLNAQAARAWLHASATLDSAALGEYAARTVERLVTATWRPGGGVARWPAETAVRGLLTDQVHVAAALLDLHDATGESRWSATAEELMRTALDTLWDARGGGFFDRPSGHGADVGLMADRLKPLATNCLAAEVLARLAVLTGDTGLHQRAVATLAAQTTTYRRHGPAGASYARAIRALFG